MFQVPQSIAQDLLLIQSLIAPSIPPPAPRPTFAPNFDCVNSSGSESDGEIDEVEADLLVKTDDDVSMVVSSDSDSSSDSEADNNATPPAKSDEIDLEEEDNVALPTTSSNACLRTKNEISEVEFLFPDIDTVGPDEQLEKVGEIMSIVGNTVIVKGNAAEVSGRASEKALDSETLLVFEDRKVLGYIFETFGPTSQPLYQIKFGDNHPLDPEKVQVARDVFQVPQRSKFVFLSKINLKGSDASNVNDEEPADEELEFSDDEQEAAFRTLRKRKREELRAGSMASSRHTTPSPALMRDQDMGESYPDSNPYAEHGPYDMDYGIAGPSRPAPIPYDDPYADTTTVASEPVPPSREGTDQCKKRSGALDVRSGFQHELRPPRGRKRGSGTRARERSGWGANDRGRQHRTVQSSLWRDSQPKWRQSDDPYDPRAPQSFSPTAPGLYDGRSSADTTTAQDALASLSWSMAQQQHFDSNTGYQQQYVQPHINPRFASAFGIDVALLQQQQQMSMQSYGRYDRDPQFQGNWPPSNEAEHSS